MSGIIASSWIPVHPWYPQPALGEPVPSGYIGIEAIDPPSGHYHIGLRHQFGNIPSGWAPGAGPCGSMRVYLPLPPSGYLPWRQSNGDIQLRPNNWPPLINSGAICCGAMITTLPQPLYPPDTGPWVASGAIASGHIGGMSIASGADFLYAPGQVLCDGCGQAFHYLSGDVRILSAVSMLASGSSWCGKCAGWREDLNRFENREDWIRESLASRFGPHMPCWALADYLEEQGRDVEARWLRTERSGR